MPTEIERKFLIDTSHTEVVKLLQQAPTHIQQGYLSDDLAATVRVRIMGDQAFLTVTGPTIGIARAEYEYGIPVDDAERMISEMCDNVLRKKRYYHRLEGGLTVEIDVVPDLDLVVAEVELPDADSQFTWPEWFIAEVSDDPRYFNSELAKNGSAGLTL